MFPSNTQDKLFRLGFGRTYQGGMSDDLVMSWSVSVSLALGFFSLLL